MKISMKKVGYFVLCVVLTHTLSLVFAQPKRMVKKPYSSMVQSSSTQQDSAKLAKERETVEMAKKVGELENIIVYNSELFRRELNAKVVWIYVLLGVMLVACLMIYGVISQISRREGAGQEKYDTLLKELITSRRNLEAQIKNLEVELKAFKPSSRKTSQSKKRK
ncbi:MAG: hypothetical protein HY088_08305 [Ignavibacteriales bacterium]|nr:hypothetical protein [Ignavibacteriales bacterium]